ncbi:MAG TPA: GH1 family beta-glucosidase [Polyangia bacterium]
MSADPRRPSHFPAPSLNRRDFLGLLGVAALTGTATAAAVPTAPVPTVFRRRQFPNGFLWGAATAAYQIEGAAAEDGRGPSIWDTFSKKPGAVFEGHTGDVACNHYHRWKEDLDLLRGLGANTYRFSVSWSRVLPQGIGAVNEKGLDFYDRLVDGLLAAKIAPNCTLFHWDLPQALHEKGGWRNPDIAGWFAEFTTVVAKRLGDRVKTWATQNEPQVHLMLGHRQGTHAPGEKLALPELLTCAHNMLRSHGRAAQALRANSSGASPQVGWVTAFAPCEPATDSPADLEAARTAQWRVSAKDVWGQGLWMEALVNGRYPDDAHALFGKDMPAIASNDFADIKQPLDFVGLNIYFSTVWRRGEDGKPQSVKVPVGYPRSAVDWQPLRPQALYWGPRHYHDRYKLPLAITESGLSTRDQVFLDGKVHDPHRVDYLNRVLLELARAIDDGVDLRGYYAWSLLDNFEWADGYKQRFGLVFVDYPSGTRIPKDSYHWYKRVIASKGKTLFGKYALSPSQMTL